LLKRDGLADPKFLGLSFRSPEKDLLGRSKSPFFSVLFLLRKFFSASVRLPNELGLFEGLSERAIDFMCQ
jgi:hypothetical protein